MKTKLIFSLFYSIAIFGAWLSLKYFENKIDSMLVKVFLADLTGALIIYLFCILTNTFSIYDPYWTIKCIVFIFYYCSITPTWLGNLRILITILLVLCWSVRLTLQCFDGLPHYNHEDWRYSDFGKKLSSHGVLYFFVGFFTFILLPTVVVYFSCGVTLYYIIYENQSNTSLGFVDIIGILVTLTGILFETVADNQLRKHLSDKKLQGQTINSGLWSACRHPNYFGEITFWFGLYIIGLASNLDLINDKFYLTSFIFGVFAIFCIIYFGSLPMMEERQLIKRKNTYASYMNEVKWKLLPINFKLIK